MIGGSHKEIHVGIVVDNADPERRGRIRVRCDTLAGPDTSLPDYVEPLFPYLAGDGEKAVAGWFFVPDVGVKVELEITTSSVRDETFGGISLDAPQIRWRACTFAVGADEISTEFLSNYPNRRGIMTAAGHGLIFDDTAGDPEVKLQQANADGTTFLDFDENGSIVMLTSQGMMLYMNQKDGELSLVDTNQNALVMNADGYYLTDANGNMIASNDTSFTFLAKQTMIFNATLANFNCAGVQVAQAGLDSAAIVEGVGTPLTVALAAALTELAAAPTLLGMPTTNTMTLIAALSAGLHTATRLSSE